MTTTKVIEEEHSEGCPCCLDEIEVRIQAFLDIRVSTPHDDGSLQVILYHNWLKLDTAYLIFGQLYRILGLYPINPFLALFGGFNESEKPQN